MPKNGQAAKCEKNLVWTWQSSYAGKHDKFAGVTISPDKKFIIASGVRGSKTKDSFQTGFLGLPSSVPNWNSNSNLSRISLLKHSFEN